MGAVKNIMSGAVLAGGGLALDRIGDLILSATGATQGPLVNYQALIGLSSTALVLLGAMVILYGIVQGLHGLRNRDREDGEEDSTNSRSRSAPSSQRDLPRNPSRN